MNEKNLLKKTIHEVMKASDFKISRIILFGSRARGNAKPTSDWDVMIIIKDEILAKAKMYYSRMYYSKR
jgi:predicted nucleotidyltransferase